MAAPKGNQFWKLRSKHGRGKLFASPELLWEAACEYFQWCDDNPLIENKVINSAKEGVIDHPTKKVRAYSLNGLTLYLGCSESYFRSFKSEKDPEKEKDFLTVIHHIEQTIYEQQFSNAAADLLNANIIARSLGLKDKTDVTTGGEKLPDSSNKMNISLPDGTNINDYIDRIKK